MGIAYVTVLILFNLLKQDRIIGMLLSAGVGVEVFLVGFQVVHDTYCPYCLAFAAIILLQFFLNFRMSSKKVIVFCLIAGFLAFALFFRGSSLPVYGGDSNRLEFGIHHSET